MIVGLLATSVVLAENGSKQNSEAKAVGSMLEIHVSDKGKVLVRGAKVSVVTADTITALTEWGSASVTWTIKTSSATEFIKRNGGLNNISEISVGDFISFSGMVDPAAGAFTVDATVVKNWSAQKARSTVTGTVKSIDMGALSFVVMSTNKGDVTVKTSNTTTFKKVGVSATFSDVTVGAKIEADGVYDSVSKILMTDKVRIQN